MFIRLTKEETKDIRVLDPLPNMNGLYYIEVTQWWINGKPIISPEVIGEGDLVQSIMDDFKKDFDDQGAGDQYKKLLNASKGAGMKLIQKSSAFWVPVLEFDWTVKNNQIVGIEGEDGQIDPDLVKKFIKDGKPKILDAKMSLLKSINRQLTAGRAGATFLDQEKGFNMLIQRAGSGKDTTYVAQREDQMPMPADMYGVLDPFEVAKSQLYTNKYIEDILANYFYGDELPKDAEYRFPELREKLKDGESAEEEKPVRRRPGRTAVAETTEEPTAPEPEAEPEQATEEAPAPARSRRRNLVKDVSASE